MPAFQTRWRKMVIALVYHINVIQVSPERCGLALLNRRLIIKAPGPINRKELLLNSLRGSDTPDVTKLEQKNATSYSTEHK